MKMVHIAYGDTYNNRSALKQLGFNWHRGDKIWVKFFEEQQDRVCSTQAEVAHLNIPYTSDAADRWIGTSVDPLGQAQHKHNSTSTGYEPPNWNVIDDSNFFSTAPPKKLSRQVFDFNGGDQIEIKTWIAKRLQKDLEMDIFFRNLELIEVTNETTKAIQAKVKFISKIAESCHLCGKGLDDPTSIATGIGPVCIKKLGIKKASTADASEILKEIDKLVVEIGEIGPIWIAKSQIKQRINVNEVAQSLEIDENVEWMKQELVLTEREQEEQVFMTDMSRVSQTYFRGE